jgi:hypothetical protein
MPIRGGLGAAVGLLVLAGTLVVGRPLEAHAIGGINTVTVSPGHGRAAAPFQVTYAVSPCVGSASLTIGFSWGALSPAGQLLGTSVTDTACRATLSTKPPVNALAGAYQVFGYVALPTGTPTPNTEASATYTVDVTPTATATTHASATAPSSATSKPTASAPPAASASASVPAASAQPASAASVRAGNLAVTRPIGQAGGWMRTWQVVGTTLLALAILALMAFMLASILRGRHRRRRPER